MKPLACASDPAMHYLTELVLSAKRTRPTPLNKHIVYVSLLRAIEERKSPQALRRLWDVLRVAMTEFTVRSGKHDSGRPK